MIDTKELRRLAQAVSEWSNCNQAWLDQSEDVPAATVGHIDEDGNTYPIATIDCDQYYAAHQSLPLAKFYAAANPSVISELLGRLEAAEKERGEVAQQLVQSEISKREISEAHNAVTRRLSDLADENTAMRAKIAEMEQQEPVAWGVFHFGGKRNGKLYSHCESEKQARMYILDRHQSDDSNTFRKAPLYALPGAKGEEK